MGRDLRDPAEDDAVARVAELRERLTDLGVTIREKHGRLIVRGMPGYEHDTTVQALVARLQRLYAESPSEVAAAVCSAPAR